LSTTEDLLFLEERIDSLPRIASLILAKSYSRRSDDIRAIDILKRLHLSNKENKDDAEDGDDGDDEVACELGFCHIRRGEWGLAVDAFSSVQPPTVLSLYHHLLATMKGCSMEVSEDFFLLEEAKVLGSNGASSPTQNLEAPTVRSLLALYSGTDMVEVCTPGNILFSSLLKNERVVDWSNENALLRLAAINQLPVDGRQYEVIRDLLDDKVGLHKLLKGSTFVPRGFVLGEEGGATGATVDPEERLDFILKDPKGWGGFGLIFMDGATVSDVVERHRTERIDNRRVVQELVRSKKVKGKCFSLRLYVVLRDGIIFYSKQCLAKYSREGERVTNSAYTGGDSTQERGWDNLRGRQEDLEELLREVFGRAGREAVGEGCIPKILGLDLMISEDDKLILIEVNATPGLISRQEGGIEHDAKKAVLEEAWGKRQGLVRVEM